MLPVRVRLLLVQAGQELVPPDDGRWQGPAGADSGQEEGFWTAMATVSEYREFCDPPI